VINVIVSVVLTTTISLSTAGLSQRSSSSVCSTILSCRVHRRQLTICFRSSKPIQISLCNVYADVVEHPPPQHASRRPIWSDMTSVDTVTQWRGDWSSASVVNHTIVTDPTVSGKGGNVTSAGWQVTLCDPMWHVSSRSSVANLRTAIHLLLTYLLLPTNLRLLIQDREHGRNLRSTTTALCQPLTTTTFAKRAFRCSAPAVWNSLPKTVLGSDSVAVSKSRRKTFSSPRLSLLSLLTNTLPGPSASEITTLWRYTNLFIIIIF